MKNNNAFRNNNKTKNTTLNSDKLLKKTLRIQNKQKSNHKR